MVNEIFRLGEFYQNLKMKKMEKYGKNPKK